MNAATAAAAKNFPPQVPLTEADINRAASEFLSASSEKRRRSRAALNSSAELARKRLTPHKINVQTARKSALSLVQESPSFRRLVSLEEQLDLSIMRKQQAIKEVVKAEAHSEARVFRLYIFNTYRSQPGSNGVTSDDVPSWSLRIQGKLLPKGEGTATDAVPPTSVGTAASPAHPPSSTTQPANATGPASSAGAGAGTTASGAGAASGNAAANASGTATGGDGSDASAAQGYGGSVIFGSTPRCSDVFSRIVVELDKDVYPKDNIVEWNRNDRDLSCDGFEISRKGSTELTVRMYLFVDHKPERYRLSTEMARLVGVSIETRAGVFTAIWQYVKKHRLQCVDRRGSVRLDEGLKSLLGPANANLEVAKMQQLFAVIKHHLAPLEPLVVEYDVRLSGDVVDNQDCYDIHVNVADTSLMESARKAGVFGLALSQSADFESLNERHLAALEKIAYHKKRREFFDGFSSNPVQFINHLILSQTRDLRVLSGTSGRNPEEERRSALYQQQWVHEAVPRYLLRKAIADTAEDTIESGLKGQ